MRRMLRCRNRVICHFHISKQTGRIKKCLLLHCKTDNEVNWLIGIWKLKNKKIKLKAIAFSLKNHSLYGFFRSNITGVSTWHKTTKASKMPVSKGCNYKKSLYYRLISLILEISPLHKISRFSVILSADQSHHFSCSKQAIVSSSNRLRITLIGFPPTM